MPFAVFKPRFTRTAEKARYFGVETSQHLHEVELSPVQQLEASDVVEAIDEAKARGFRAPIVGEVA